MNANTLQSASSTFVGATKLVESSSLPDKARLVISQVVRHTRLWKREKAEVAAELIAHFADGLEAGRGVEDLIATFGDLRQAARLIRRGKRRNRPLWWHLQHRLWQGAVAFVGLYLLLVGWLLLGHPSPSVDYLAKLNATALAAKPDDCAWPLYRQAWLVDDGKWFSQEQMDVFEVKLPDGQYRNQGVQPTDPGWPAAVSWLHQHKAILDLLRQAATKKHFGLVLKNRKEDYAEIDRKALFSQAVPAPTARDDGKRTALDASLIVTLLPYLNTIRASANLLAEDQKLAVVEGDADRVIADYAATMALHRHVRETPFLVNALVGFGCAAMADEHLVGILHSHPQLLAGREAELAHLMAESRDSLKLDLSGEQYLMLDMIQRTYSDDGHGGGHITLDGLQTMGLLAGPHNAEAARFKSVWTSLALPLAVMLTADRADLTAKTNELYNLYQSELASPYWQRRASPGAEALIQSWKSSRRAEMHYVLLSILAPSLNRAMETASRIQAYHDGVMAVVAIQAFHRDTSHYPATLAELTPSYLPFAPIDMRTGEPMNYRVSGDSFVLYARGQDNQDHGGVADPDEQNPWNPKHGDWVIFPPAKDN